VPSRRADGRQTAGRTTQAIAAWVDRRGGS
jgi:hypothetical protein